MDEATLGKRLQLARKRAGLTQQELCQKAGLSYSTLAKIERGAIKTPSVFTVAAISMATGTSLEDLLEIETSASASESGKKRSNSGVTFVYFDVNGTLARFFERAFTKISKESGKPIEIIESLFWHYDGPVARGSQTSQEVEKILGNEFGLKDFSWEKYYMDSVEPTPGSKEILQWAAENYDVGLLTNNWPGYTDELIKKGIVPNVNYTAIVESGKVGCSKPEAKIYKMAQDLAGVKPDEILLVDDTQAYLAGAEQAGWQSLMFDGMHPEASIKKVKAALEF